MGNALNNGSEDTNSLLDNNSNGHSTIDDLFHEILLSAILLLHIYYSMYARRLRLKTRLVTCLFNIFLSIIKVKPQFGTS